MLPLRVQNSVGGFLVMLGAVIYAMIIYSTRLLIWVGWWRWRISGLEKLPPRAMGGMLVVMNHVHWLDILALGTLMPYSYRLSWLGKVELFETSLSNWFFRTVNVIPINRGKRDVSALDASDQALQEGAVLVVFPEGHRSGDGVLQRGFGGVARLAIRNNVPIIPAAITGTQKGVAGSMRGEEVHIQLGTPYVIDLPAEQKVSPRVVNEMTTDMMQRIAAMLPEEWHGYYHQSAASLSDGAEG